MRDLQKKGVPQVTKEKLHVASLMCFTFCCFYYRLTGCALEPPQQGCVIGLRQATVYHTGKCNFTLHTVHNHSRSQNDTCIRIYTFTDSRSQIHIHRFTFTDSLPHSCTCCFTHPHQATGTVHHGHGVAFLDLEGR